MDLREEIFPDGWITDVNNWSRKRYCPVCKSSLSGASNCFKSHSQDFHDHWADLVQPWVKWKGLRNKKENLTESIQTPSDI